MHAQSTEAYRRYVIPGKPVPLQRPRFSGTRVYDAQKHEKNYAAIHFAQQHNGDPYFEAPLFIVFRFYFPTPNKTKSLNGKHHTSRPDLDNLVKFYCDAALNVLYEDDAIIAGFYAVKLYDTQARTELFVRPFQPLVNAEQTPL